MNKKKDLTQGQKAITAEMDYRVPALKLNTGAKMPPLGLGTWQMSNKDAEESVYVALELGYRMIDTASLYGNETGVGKGIARAMNDYGINRKEIFITTKIWNSEHKSPKKAINASLRRLGLDFIDLYLIHWPVKESLATWKKFEEFKKAGLAKNIGVSNFTIKHIELLIAKTNEVPSVNQVELSPFLYQSELIDYCRQNKIQIQSYSPIMRGNRLDNPVLKEIALAHNKTPAQVALRWHMQLGLAPIPKSSNPQRIKENFGVFDFSLSETEMEAFCRLTSGVRYCWNPESAAFRLFEGATKMWKVK